MRLCRVGGGAASFSALGHLTTGWIERIRTHCEYAACYQFHAGLSKWIGVEISNHLFPDPFQLTT